MVQVLEKDLAYWFNMNWVLENLVQGISGGLEDMLLEFWTHDNYDKFYKTKEPSKIWEYEFPSDSIIKTLDFKEICPSDSTKKIPEL